MKRMVVVVGVVFLVSVAGAYTFPAHAAEGNDKSYTATTPSMGAIAEWAANFINLYQEKNIYTAVAEVFEEGRTPAEIVNTAMEIEGLNPQNLVAALYCAGARHEDIRTAAEDADISEMILVAGFETAKTVCGEAITDIQAYTPVGPNFNGIPDGSDDSRTFASPAAF